MRRLHLFTRSYGLAIALALVMLAQWTPLLPQVSGAVDWRPPIALFDTCPGMGEGDTCG